jgi:hypothetical protein
MKQNTASQVLEVTIDDLEYVSHPIGCAENDLLQTTSVSEGVTQFNSDSITQFNVIIAVARENAVRRILARGANEVHSSVQDPMAVALGINKHFLFPPDRNILRTVVERYSMALLLEEKRGIL